MNLMDEFDDMGGDLPGSGSHNAKCPFCGGQVDPDGWLNGAGQRGPECESCGATAPNLMLWNSAQPAQQHQGEPVAWTWQGSLDTLRGYCSAGVAVFPHKSPGTPIPLYTHADPAEVERLRAENEAFDAGMRNLACQLSAGGYNAETLTAAQLLEKVQWGFTHLTETQARLVDTLRAQLAEAHALLRKLMPECPPRFHAGIDAALSASAEPSEPKFPRVEIVKAHKHTCANVQPGSTSADICDCGAVVDGEPVQVEPGAPVEIDERAEFEAAWSARIERLRIRERGNEFYRVQPNDLYRWNNVQDAWELWQARAALGRKS